MNAGRDICIEFLSGDQPRLRECLLPEMRRQSISPRLTRAGTTGTELGGCRESAAVKQISLQA